MKKLSFLFSVLIVSFANTTNAQYILTMNFDQMDFYVGQAFELRVTEIATGDEVGRKSISAIEGSSFSIELYVLLEGRDYNVDFYIDVNGNGSYNTPPTDLAWRRTVINANQHTTLDFVPDVNFTDIGFPDAFPYSTYDAVWGGKWMNLTFGSTDSIQASFTLECDSIFGFLSTKGVFGNPATVEFNYADIRPSGDEPPQDTIHYSPGPPWTGEILIIDEKLYGNISSSGFTLEFTGTIGAHQVMALYEVLVGGTAFANGYFYIKELEVLYSAPTLEIVQVEITDVSCGGLADGSISVNVTGGIPGYSYLWSNGDTTSLIVNLLAGDYELTISDAEGCTVTATYNVSGPEPIEIMAQTFDASCFHPCNGAIQVFVTGGVPPFNYVWNTGHSGEQLFNLCEGIYILTVVDAIGCTAVMNLEIAAPDPIVVDITVTDVSCFDFCDGTIALDVSGGTPPYMLPPPFELCAGDYVVVVIDDAGCVYQDSATIGSPEELVITNIEIINATDGQANGSVTVSVGSGIPPYEYSLDGGAYQVSNVFTNLPAGEYCVFIRDGNGCMIKSVTFIINNLTDVKELDARFKVFPNPASDLIQIESDQPVSITLLDIHGILLKETYEEKQHSISVDDLPSGIYIMRISNGKEEAIRKIAVQNGDG